MCLFVPLTLHVGWDTFRISSSLLLLLFCQALDSFLRDRCASLRLPAVLRWQRCALQMDQVCR